MTIENTLNNKKVNHSRLALKAGIWYTFSNFLSRGLVFLTTPIFTRMLSKSDFGEYSNFATWQTLLLVLTTLDLYATVSRAKFDYKDNIDQYISSISLLGTSVTFISYIVVIMFIDIFERILGMDSLYIHIMFLYLLSAPALQILQAKYRVYMKYKIATLLTVLSSMLSVFVAVSFVYFFEDKLFGRILGQEVVLIIFNMCIYAYIILKGRSFKKEHCKYALLIALPLIPHLLAGNLLATCDKLMIQYFRGPEELALYSLSVNCALLVRVLWESLNQAMVPWLYDKIHNNEYKEIKRVSRQYLVVFLMVALIIMLFTPEIVLIFGGKEYLVAKYVMPPVIMGCCFQFAYSMYVNVEIFYKKTYLISIGTVSAAAVNILLNFIFIDTFGYIGAAYATLICYALLMFCHYYIVRKMKVSKMYDNMFNFIMLGAMMLATMLIVVLYDYDNFRRLSIVIIFIFVLIWFFRKKKEIRLFLKNK